MAITRRSFVRIMGIGGAAAMMGACRPAAGIPRADQPEPATPDQPEVGQPTPKILDRWQPAFARLEAEGKLAERVEQAMAMMEACNLCPRRCGVNRMRGQQGFCQTADRAVVFSYSPHFGEELPLVGRNGSGTIFFSNCNLRCVFCQNWPIAHEGRGEAITDERLADVMLDIQRMGCHNVNLVTPTHVMPNILNATRIALKRGLQLPLCYNTGGYDLPNVVKLLDGVVDIYLPDLKFMDGAEAKRYSFAAAADYPVMAQESILEMHRQVGVLVTDRHNIALRGLMIRHLVMPNRISGAREFVAWVAENLPLDTYVNIMSQYRVEHRAFEYERIARAITSEEFVEAMEWALEAGLTNLDDRSLGQLELHRRRMRRSVRPIGRG